MRNSGFKINSTSNSVRQAQPHNGYTRNAASSQINLEGMVMKVLLATLLAFNAVCAYASQPTSFVVDTDCSFANAIMRVKQAAIDHNFRIVRERDLSVKGVKVHAIWFCNFELLDKAIRKHKQVGYILPFRITVEEHNGKISISAQNPDRPLGLVKSKLGNICNVITADYKAILNEASL